MPRLPARDYRISIPSYQRPLNLMRKTLPLLLSRGVQPERITVYLHHHDPELPTYHGVLRDNGIQHRTTSEHGITAQRTRIVDDHPPGTPIVSMDDDLSNVQRALDHKTLGPVEDLDQFFRDMFTETAGRDLNVWGISPVPNAYFLKPGRTSDGLKFLMFTLFGFFNRPGHPVHDFTVRYKDEHEFSLRAWWYDGATLRHDGVAVQAEYYAPGGCQAAGRDVDQVEASVQSLLRQWPGLVRRNQKRESGWPEILLSPKKRHAGHPASTPPPGITRDYEAPRDAPNAS